MEGVKAFMRQVMVFGSFFPMYFLGVFLLNGFLFHDSSPPVTPSHLLVSGDSHLRHAIDPSVFPSLANVSVAGEPYVVTYWKLKYLFEMMDTLPDTVLLGFNHHNISTFVDAKFDDIGWSADMYRRTLYIQDYWSIKDQVTLHPKLLAKSLFTERCLVPDRSGYFDFIGGFQAARGHDLSGISKRIKRHYQSLKNYSPVSTFSLSYMDSIQGLCHRKNVQAVFIGTPVHSQYFDKIPTELKSAYDAQKALLIQRGVPVLDLTQYPLESTYFYDGDHLNEQGAEYFSAHLDSIFRAGGISPLP